MNKDDFSKDFFQTSWGKDGYYENFSYGLGIDAVCQVAIHPFKSYEKKCLEIGCGGGVFTERLIQLFKNVTGIDVIKMPERFKSFDKFEYIELPNQSFDCNGITDESIDFCFSYNVFCHISNEGLKEYLKNINRVLKPGADFVFMLANYEHSKIHFAEQALQFSIGEMTPIGHFYQSDETLDLIADKNQWDTVNSNLLPDHRDIIIHLRKK
jgi:SAM-dependent methyltransferase